jgi:glycosyltransferase involved in cell wall biosynthesis
VPEAAGEPVSGMRVLWTHNFNAALLNGLVLLDTAARALRERGVDLTLEYLGNLRSARTLWEARHRVRRLAPSFDIVHAQYGSACALATAGAEGVPKVVSIRGADWNPHRAGFGFHYVHTRLARGMTRRSLSRYDCIISVSRRMAGELVAVAPGSQVVTLPTPIDLERFVPRDKADARTQLGFPGNREKWVLFNAKSLEDPIKRFPLAREVFARAQRRRGDLRLRIATELPYAMLPLFAAACDVILCTSDAEGWPNSVKEALACNVPFVSTDVSDLAEIAREEPSCRVCPAEPAALAEALCEVVERPAGADLRRHVLSMSVDASSGRLIGLYQALCSDRAGTDR